MVLAVYAGTVHGNNMSNISGKLLRAIGLALLTACGVQAARAAGAAPQPAPQAPPMTRTVASSAPDQRALLDKYCVSCHSERVKTAGLSLSVGPGACRAGRRGVGKGRGQAAHQDHAAGPDATARPGRLHCICVLARTRARCRCRGGAQSGALPIHRLNRPEYANAIRDLLALDIDVSAMLPVDESGHGFDNIADILTFSPGLLERYMIAAQKISRLAVGDPTIRPSTETYKVSIYLPQDDRMGEDLPFGSRGGTAIRHYFPLTANTASRSVCGAPSSLRDLRPPQSRADRRSDGRRARRAVRGRRRLRQFDGAKCIRPVGGTVRRPSTSDADAGLEVRLPVKAGHALGGRRVREERPGTGAAPEGEMLTAHAADLRRASTTIATRCRSKPSQIHGPLASAGGRRYAQPAADLRSAGPRRAQRLRKRCAKTILKTLARRAYRRPSPTRMSKRCRRFYRTGRNERDSRPASSSPSKRCSSSPDFLFRVERDPAGVGAGAPPTGSATSSSPRACRSSSGAAFPTTSCSTLAEQGTAEDPAVLEQQVRRMLADPRATALVSNFAGQWLLPAQHAQRRARSRQRFPSSTTTSATRCSRKPSCSSRASCARIAASSSC